MNTVTCTMLARLPPARFMIWSICENTCFTCASKLLAMSRPSLSRVAVCPASQTIFPPSVTTPGENARDSWNGVFSRYSAAVAASGSETAAARKTFVNMRFMFPPGQKWSVIRGCRGPTGPEVKLTQTADRDKQGSAHRSIDRDFARGVAWPRHRTASEAAPNPSPKAQRSRYGDRFHRQRQARQRQRAGEHPPPLGAARGAEAHRHQIRLRCRPVRRVHGAHRRRPHVLLPHARVGGAGQGGHHYRRPFARSHERPAARLARRERASVRLLPVGPADERRGAARREPAPDARGNQGP